MNERVKELRKELGLSGEKFGEKLGVKRSAISDIETGRNNLTDQMLKAICREFNVNEEWLRSGAGAMFVEDSDSIIDKILSEMPLDDLSQTILRAYIEMDARKREVFNSSIKELAAALMADSKEKAVSGINEAILNSKATDAVKIDLYGKTALVFNDAFPYIGTGNIENSELEALSTRETEDIGEDIRAKIEEEVEAYRKELEAEAKGAEKLSASGESGGNTRKEMKKSV